MSGSISTGVPTSWLIPGVDVTVNNALANTSTPAFRVAIFADTTATGSVQNIPVLATDPVAMATAFPGTISTMYTRYRTIDPNTEVWFVPVTLNAGVPDMTDALNSLQDMEFALLVGPYTDNASLTTINTFLTARWGYSSQLYGEYLSAQMGTSTSLETFASTQNIQYVSILACPTTTDTVGQVAAAFAAAVAVRSSADPSLAIQEIVVNITPWTLANNFNKATRNALLTAGLSTVKLNSTNSGVILERCVTLYKTNTAGQPDNSYQDLETMFQIPYVSQFLNTELYNTFVGAGLKLVAVGTRIPNGSNFVTSETVLQQAIAAYYELADAGQVQNPDVFASAAYATQAHGVVNLYLPVQIANQLRQINIELQFTKP